MKNWLKEELRDRVELTFDVVNISEQRSVIDQIKYTIAEELLKGFCSVDELKHRFHNKPQEYLRKTIMEKTFPDKTAPYGVYWGDWGELFCGLFLTRFKDHSIPVYKMRFKENRNQSVRSLDLLTFDEVFGDVYFNEIKTKTRALQSEEVEIGDTKVKRKDVLAFKAYKELEHQVNNNCCDVLETLAKKCRVEKNYDMADMFDQLIMSNYNAPRGVIFLLFDKQHWKEELLSFLNDQNPQLTNFHVVVILIENLYSLVDETYALTLEVAKQIVYG